MLCKWNHIMYNLLRLAFFFHSGEVPWDPSKFLCISVVCSFLLLSNIPLYTCTTVYLTIYPLRDSLIVTSFRLLKIKLSGHKFWFFWDKCPRVQLLGYVVSAYLDFERNCKTILQSWWAILHSNKKSMRDPLSLYPCKQLVSLFFIFAILIGVQQ